MLVFKLLKVVEQKLWLLQACKNQYVYDVTLSTVIFSLYILKLESFGQGWAII